MLRQIAYRQGSLNGGGGRKGAAGWRWRRGGDSNPRSRKGSRDFESRRLNQTPEPLRELSSIKVCSNLVKLDSARLIFDALAMQKRLSEGPESMRQGRFPDLMQNLLA